MYIQGTVHWQPPEEALEKVKHIVFQLSTSRYAAHEGIPDLRQALTNKVCVCIRIVNARAWDFESLAV